MHMPSVHYRPPSLYPHGTEEQRTKGHFFAASQLCLSADKVMEEYDSVGPWNFLQNIFYLAAYNM
jgi:hypothetical protein